MVMGVMWCTCMQDNDDELPWLFLTSPQHDPLVYGYRSVILERDYYWPLVTTTTTATTTTTTTTSGPPFTVQYRVSISDETEFTTLTCLSHSDDDDDDDDDFHRRYRPYHRLITSSADGSDDTADNTGATTNAAAAATAAVRLRLCRSDDVKLVHRPIVRTSSTAAS